MLTAAAGVVITSAAVTWLDRLGTISAAPAVAAAAIDSRLRCRREVERRGCGPPTVTLGSVRVLSSGSSGSKLSGAAMARRLLERTLDSVSSTNAGLGVARRAQATSTAKPTSIGSVSARRALMGSLLLCLASCRQRIVTCTWS